MRRRQGTIKAVVQRTEKSGVGMLYGGGGASQLSKPTERGLDHFRGLVAVEMICNISMPNHKVLKVGTTPSAVEPLRLPPALIPGLLTLPIQVCQPVVIEREAAKEDFGNLFLVIISVPIRRHVRRLVTVLLQLVQKILRAVVHGGGEDLFESFSAPIGAKLFIIIFNCIDLLANIAPITIGGDKGGEAGL
ncbi:amino acid adenylation domain-containing protein [Babesia caballi]|uniref:Amino acid adenylation domain-containing protein n=1 Tax=Babesia caballi TaxID=5871 RepID=A0AAV4LQX4_BABCB|nr:amino acid adenylation domain-containing protein [Babesia caballi]